MANTQNEDVMLRMRGIKKSFGSVEVLRGIDLTVRRGEVLAIIGPSGSGKSTLLRCMNRLEEISGGSVEIEGEVLATTTPAGAVEYTDAATCRRLLGCTGMVFQQFNLFPHMTVLANIMLAPMKVRQVPKEEAEERARKLLARVGLADKAESYPQQLSGGQQQRVAIIYLVMTLSISRLVAYLEKRYNTDDRHCEPA